ncbi:MAG TPA: hypothetical protein VMF51_13975, partial [Nocardioides sp.]|uniref:hypothetical protein n=1 Tax=Nocardioides sp. TaxID=35761 RepID=UPI002C933A3B
MVRRILARVVVTLAVAVAGAAFMSGSDQPVTARPYPSWQELARPPLSPRTHALGVHVGHLVLVLGGVERGGPRLLGDGAAYDLSTGVWHRLRLPMAVTDRDQATATGGVVVLRHALTGRPATWWRYDVRLGTWTRMTHLPRRPVAPSAFGSEVYALSGRRVV